MKIESLRHRVIVGGILLMSAIWHTSSVSAQFFRLSEADELALGRHAAVSAENDEPVLRDPWVQASVDRLGQRLARQSARNNIPYHFKVLDLKEVNAFALPGGYIYVQRGVLDLAHNESEVAGVLAHEISHVVLRHSVDQLARAQ